MPTPETSKQPRRRGPKAARLLPFTWEITTIGGPEGAQLHARQLAAIRAVLEALAAQEHTEQPGHRGQAAAPDDPGTRS